MQWLYGSKLPNEKYITNEKFTKNPEENGDQ